MIASYLEFLVEDVSTELFLKSWLTSFLPETCGYGVYAFRGKEALLRRLPNRLQGYASWLPSDHRVVIVVDCDSDRCEELKSRMEDICEKAGLVSRRASSALNWQVVTRIAIEELEAWYFGDWEAVLQTYPRVPTHIPDTRSYRNPDAIAGGTWEAFERILQGSGYFAQGLAKTQVATAVGGHINPSRNRSRSFMKFRDAIVEAVT